MRSNMYAALTWALVAPAAFGAKYDGMTVTFDRPMEAVHQAAVDALTVLGVDIKKNDAAHVEGKRRNKVGFVVGSGGEVLSVSLTSIDADTTEAKVRTTKTFVGRAGQKVWDQPMIDEMKKALGLAVEGEAATAPSEDPAADAEESESASDPPQTE